MDALPEIISISTDGEEFELQPEEKDQLKAGPDLWHSKADNREKSDHLVAGSALFTCGKSGKRKADDDREDHATN